MKLEIKTKTGIKTYIEIDHVKITNSKIFYFRNLRLVHEVKKESIDYAKLDGEVIYPCST